LKPEIFAAIMDHFATNLPVIKEGGENGTGEKNESDHYPTDENMKEEDKETVELIKELLGKFIKYY
jgi:hypothetical protein